MENILRDCFIKNGTRIVVEKGTVLLSPHNKDDASKVYYLEKGSIALLTYSKEGTESIYQYFIGGRLVGFMPFLFRAVDGVSKYKKTMGKDQFLIAKTKSTLYQIDHELFDRLLAENIEFNHLLLQSLVVNYMDLLNHFQHTQEECAGTRLCRFLMEYYEITECRTLPKDMSFIEIGKYLGIHSVSVSRLFAVLRREGCVVKNNGEVIITDLNRLQQLIKAGKELK